MEETTINQCPSLSSVSSKEDSWNQQNEQLLLLQCPSHHSSETIQYNPVIKKESKIKKKHKRLTIKSIEEQTDNDNSSLMKNNDNQALQNYLNISKKKNFTKQDFVISTMKRGIPQYLQRPIENYRCFLCAGDMMIEFYNDRDVVDCQDRRMKNFVNFKRVQQTEKVGDNIRLVLNSKENVLNDLTSIISLLENKQDQYFYYFAQLLKKYNAYLKISQAYIESVLEAYRPNNLGELNLIKELRQAYHIDFMDNQIAKYASDEFYCIVQVGPNFNTKAPGYNILQFNKAMVALLGTEEEQMISINMRNGFRDFIYSNNKNDMYIKYLDGIVNGVQNCQQADMIAFDTKLFTYDHIIIPCKCLIKRFEVPMPKQLEYKSTTGEYFNLDMINYMQFQIDFNQIKRVLEQRQNFNYQEVIQDQMDSLEYSVRSQIFIEKFYPDQTPNH